LARFFSVVLPLSARGKCFINSALTAVLYGALCSGTRLPRPKKMGSRMWTDEKDKKWI